MIVSGIAWDVAVLLCFVNVSFRFLRSEILLKIQGVVFSWVFFCGGKKPAGIRETTRRAFRDSQ